MCSANMSSVIMKDLSSEDTSRIYNALVAVRTDFIKNASRMELFQKEGIVKLLISFIEQPKFCNVSLSILATCCLRSGFRREVIERGGIPCLIRVLKSLANDEILNRVVRALGNIATCKQGSDEIRKYDVIKPLILFLSSTKDCNCQQSALRTLRILGEDRELKKLIISLNGVFSIASLLTSTNENVLKVCVKALASLTRSCTFDSALQLQKADALPVLVNLYNGTCREIGKYALIIFENLTCLPPMVVGLSNNKVLEIFIKEASSDENDVKTIQAAALSICLCCKHYRNRDDIRKLGGLPILINILKSNEFIGIRSEILPALILLCSEINDLDKLRELKLLPVCIKLLENYVVQNKKEHDWQENEDKGDDVTCELKKRIECGVSGVKITRSTSNPGSNDAVFSIHSPTYQGLQLSEPSTSAAYRSYVSPLNTVTSISSPDFSYDWNPSSPVSCCSPLGPWSPGSSNNDHASMCWSPVISHSNTSDSSPDRKDPFDDIAHLSDSDENGAETHNQESVSGLQFVNVRGTVPLAPLSISQEPVSQGSPVVASPIRVPETVVKKRKHEDLNSDSNDSYRSQPMSEFELVLKNLSEQSSKKRTSLIMEECQPSPKGIDHCILTLLGHLAYNLERTSNSEIVEEINVGVLLDYVAQLPSPNQKAIKILYSLISNRYSFEKLIMCNFIGQVESRIETPHDTDLCQRCDRLLNVKNKLILMGKLTAESEFGIGSLIHVMVTSDSAAQLNCLYAIGKLVESKKMLGKIFFASRGFKILQKYLTSEQEAVFKTAARCLSMVSLSIVGKYEYRSVTMKKSVCDRTCQFGTNSFNLTISLDDGTSVSASREQLSTNCEFFSLMLEGQFVEASQDVVSLSSISKEVLLLILHLLHGCSADTCIYWEHLNVNILLKLLEASERFLLPMIKRIVQEKIVMVMGKNDIFTVYSMAKLHCPALIPSILHFLLCSTIVNDNDYSEVLQSIIVSEGKDFFKGLKKFLKECIINPL